MQLHDLKDADIDRVIRRTMEHLEDFVSVKKLNNAQLKQLVEKIEVDEDGTVDVYLRLFAETEQVNVVYKRKGNTYGLIEPEF